MNRKRKIYTFCVCSILKWRTANDIVEKKEKNDYTVKMAIVRVRVLACTRVWMCVCAAELRRITKYVDWAFIALQMLPDAKSA